MAVSPRSNNQLSDIGNSALMEDFSDNLENMQDVDDDELHNILESKTEFIELPMAHNLNNANNANELMQESQFVYAKNVELLPSTANYLEVPAEPEDPKPSTSRRQTEYMEQNRLPDNEKAQSEDDRHELKHELERVKADLESCKHQLEAEIDKNGDKDERIRHLTVQIENLNSQIEEQKQIILEGKTLVNKLEIEKQSLIERMQLTHHHDESLTQAKLDNLAKENNRVNDDLQDKIQLLREKDSTIERLNHELVDVQKSQDNDLKLKEIELHKAKLTNENLEKQNDHLMTIIDQLKNDLINSKIEVKDMETKIYSQNDRNYQLTTELAFAKSQVETLRAQLQDSMGSNKTYSRQLEYKLNDLQQEFAMKTKEMERDREREHENKRYATEREQPKYTPEYEPYNISTGVNNTIKNVQNQTAPNFYSKKKEPEFEIPDNAVPKDQVDAVPLENKRQAYTRADRARQRKVEHQEPPKPKVDRIPKRQAPDKPTLVMTEKEKTPQQIEKEQLESEINTLQDQRREMENEFNKLSKTPVRSGALIKRKKELESDLLFINKNLSTLKNKLRIMKHEFY